MRTMTWKAAAITGLALFFVLPAAAQSERAYLGVYLSELSDGTRRALGLSEDLGVLVERVSSDGPAEDAGMQDGDVIVEIEGREIDGQSDLNRRAISELLKLKDQVLRLATGDPDDEMEVPDGEVVSEPDGGTQDEVEPSSRPTDE